MSCQVRLRGSNAILRLKAPQFRLSSTAAVDSANGSVCPHASRAAGSASASASASAAPSSVPELKHVPSLPYVGSLLPRYSGAPPLDLSSTYDYFPTLRRRYGEFHTVGIPGMGQGDSRGTVYVIVDPEEMMKVVRSEGSHPSGSIEGHWMTRRAFRDTGSPLVDGDDYGLFGRGDRWKRQRAFLQSGMLDPRAARGFVPGIAAAARAASASAPAHREGLNAYLNYCAVDMFGSFMFGELTGIAARPPDALDGDGDGGVRLFSEVMRWFELAEPLSLSPYQKVVNEKLGLRTREYGAFEDQWTKVRRLAMEKIKSFLARHERGDLMEMERASYLAGAIERQSAEGAGGVSEEEMMELCIISVIAAVDTTSSVTAWNLVHLALNPDVQERLHTELSRAIAESEARGIDAQVLKKSSTPYLHAFVRESLRMTPPFMMAQVKTNQQRDVEIHGVTIPKGSTVMLAHVGSDETYVEDPEVFRPERWSPEEVEARKGTKAELIDHPLLRDPFMAGARRCPASRVATNEVLAMIAQLVLDWKISSPRVKSLDEICYNSPIVKPEIPELDFVTRAQVS